MRIAELEYVKRLTVRRQKEFLDEIKQRLAEKVSVWKETSLENTDCLMNDVKVANVDSVKISV